MYGNMQEYEKAEASIFFVFFLSSELRTNRENQLKNIEIL